MPCRDDYPDNRTQFLELEYRVAQKATKETEQRIRAELEPLLCEAMTVLENEGSLPGQLSPELLAWYKNHSEKEKDRLRLEAAQKLTEKERQVLGINIQELARIVQEKKNK